jgi:hypothetical protein
MSFALEQMYGFRCSLKHITTEMLPCVASGATVFRHKIYRVCRAGTVIDLSAAAGRLSAIPALQFLRQNK